MEKIEGTAENWDNRVLGADARYARRVSPEQEQELDMIVKYWSNPDGERTIGTTICNITNRMGTC